MPTMRNTIRQYFLGLLLPILFLVGALGQVHAEENPQIKIQTNHGDIYLELFADKAPITVANFLKYVDENFYTNTLFHRVMAGFMIQGGGFTTTFERKPTHATIINEADNGLSNLRGTIAMARTPDPNSATAQFFINVADNTFLDFKNKTPEGYGYAVFGKVTRGMEVVDTIAKLATGAGGPFVKDVPKTSAIILGITQLNKKSDTPAAPAKTGTP